jgi:hypothetical protein
MNVTHLRKLINDKLCEKNATGITADELVQVFVSLFDDPPPAEGKEVVVFIDEDDFGHGFLAHSRRSAHEWLDAFLENLDVGEPSEVRFKVNHMTKAEIEAMPEI